MRKLIFVLLALVLVSCYSPADVVGDGFDTPITKPIDTTVETRLFGCIISSDMDSIFFVGGVKTREMPDTVNHIISIKMADYTKGDTIYYNVPLTVQYKISYKNDMRTISPLNVINDTIIYI